MLNSAFTSIKKFIENPEKHSKKIMQKKGLIFFDTGLKFTEKNLKDVCEECRNLNLNLMLSTCLAREIFNRIKDDLQRHYFYTGIDIDIGEHFVCKKNEILNHTVETINFKHLKCFTKDGFCRFFAECEFTDRFFSRTRMSIAITTVNPYKFAKKHNYTIINSNSRKTLMIGKYKNAGFET